VSQALLLVAVQSLLVEKEEDEELGGEEVVEGEGMEMGGGA